MKSKFNKDYSYPEPNDKDLQEKIFTKREFYFNKVPQRPILHEIEDIQKYRATNCKDGEFEPRDRAGCFGAGAESGASETSDRRRDGKI